jgi:hypothetical protein
VLYAAPPHYCPSAILTRAYACSCAVYAPQGLEKYLRALMKTGPKGAMGEQIKVVSRNSDVLAFLGWRADGDASELPSRVLVSVASGFGGFEVDDGLWVTQVDSDGPAAAAGVAMGWRCASPQFAVLSGMSSRCNIPASHAIEE